MHSAIDNLLSNPPYYPCLLFAYREPAVLYARANALQAQYSWPILALGEKLTPGLLPMLPRERQRAAPRLLVEAIRTASPPGPLLVTQIDLLFEPSLGLDPLGLLRSASRQRTLIVAWPGSYESGVLAYAVPEHSHYRIWAKPDLCEYCVQVL
ncbi:MAG: BREX-3 system P-loop-containing protein BrxF [Caldilineaceae bacterium]|nr:BREX-3 system P-loop-containing protein BrxF [Caldilineaceae bacterium]